MKQHPIAHDETHSTRSTGQPRPFSRPMTYQRVGVVGGGTAGYLAALTLNAVCPDLDITLIESSKIPVIGVGESTTSEIVPFLHLLLNIDVGDFYTHVQPTWKLGIKFLWGQPGQYYFTYPFDRGNIISACAYDGDITSATLLSCLVAKNKVPVFTPGQGIFVSMLGNLPFGYHLDNRMFLAFLKREAIKRGIKCIDLTVEDAILDAEGENVSAICTREQGTVQFDLYVDCTGFRSLLIEQKLKSPYLSYSSSLFTDSAVVANCTHDGIVKPYTTAETMNSGWCWTIPQMVDDHLGYVYSSAFSSEEQAVSELRRNHPEIGDHWSVTFRSGRHQHFWKGNVVAIGNSYGFVEPLESTGIFVICRQALLVALSLRDTVAPAIVERINRLVAETWDYIRWFLAIHYKFNKRMNSPFWRECWNSVDISGATSILRSVQECSMDDYHGANTDPVGSGNFDRFGYSVLLLGQQVPMVNMVTHESRSDYMLRIENYRSLVDLAIDQHTVLGKITQTEKQLLYEAVSGQDNWATAFAAQLKSWAHTGITGQA